MAGFFILVGLGGMLAGIISLIKPLRFLRIHTRKTAAGVLAGSFILMVIGGAILPPADSPPQTEAEYNASVSQSKLAKTVPDASGSRDQGEPVRAVEANPSAGALSAQKLENAEREAYVQKAQEIIKTDGFGSYLQQAIDGYSIQISIISGAVDLMIAGHPLKNEDRKKIQDFISEHHKMMRYIYNNDGFKVYPRDREYFDTGKKFFTLLDKPIDLLDQALKENDLYGMSEAVEQMKKIFATVGIQIW